MDPELKREMEEKAVIKKLIGDKCEMNITWSQIDLLDDWAFADTAEQNAAGDYILMISALLKKSNGQWRILAVGSPNDPEWQEFTKDMPEDIRDMFTQWQESVL